MHRIVMVVGMIGGVGMALACGGVGVEECECACDEASEAALPSPAFKTFSSKGFRKTLAFLQDEVTVTWKHMSGRPVDGTWTREGDTLTLTWGVTPNYGFTEETYAITSECTLAFVQGTFKKDGSIHRQPQAFTLNEPRCR
ncbi:MAG: hypothetical protein KTR31_18345 [Myxococcales bacterium]|nr:hypothetical protein [Myxococcales bacterium]